MTAVRFISKFDAPCWECGVLMLAGIDPIVGDFVEKKFVHEACYVGTDEPKAAGSDSSETKVPLAVCSATTRQGTPCPITIPEGATLCHIHNPDLQCGFIKKSKMACRVATGGGRCSSHR